jgi:hypothetical protein
VERHPIEPLLLRVLNAILPWFVILLAITGSMVFGGRASNPVKPMHGKQANPHPWEDSVSSLVNHDQLEVCLLSQRSDVATPMR